MVHNTTGNFNVAEGLNALVSNTTGSITLRSAILREAT